MPVAYRVTQGLWTDGPQEQGVKANLPKGGLTLDWKPHEVKTGELQDGPVHYSQGGPVKAGELQHGSVRYSRGGTARRGALQQSTPGINLRLETAWAKTGEIQHGTVRYSRPQLRDVFISLLSWC